MKKIIVLIFLNTYVLNVNGQVNLSKKIHENFRDSIVNKYVYNGAWYFPMFSRGWQVCLDSALIYLPQDAYLWQQKAMPYFKQMKYEAGTPFLDSAVKYNSKKYLEYRAFMKCIFQKNYQEAIVDFKDAIKLNGNSGVMDHPYTFYIGLSYLQLNKFDSCVLYLNACIQNERKERNWVHYLHTFYYGICLYELRRYDEAIVNFDSTLSQYNHFSDAKFYKARCLSNIPKEIKATLDLLNEAKNDFQSGYTINEDNSKYEKYPYQINFDLIDMYYKILVR
jgi:tetratricopeptide (TPR) repeat protein